ncbi:unnamed protein product [Trifolium pratense]|uniref:Uncharacterized protein n=1 Tax=Trifolium pratense TaxID=57577 RepID=A0ACB0K783_TRIPR|nr:unnamed protein product [Trifolium pratense]
MDHQGEEEGNPQRVEANRLLIEALTARMQQMMRTKLEGLHERIDQIENRFPNGDEEERRRRRHVERPRNDRLSGIKIKVASIEFKEYALVWWDQLIKERRRYGEQPIGTWEEMKRIMRRRFVPSYYHRDLHNKLQRLTQGSKSVEEYFKEMEVLKLELMWRRTMKQPWLGFFMV